MPDSSDHQTFSRRLSEEHINAATHAFGFLLSLVGMVFLLQQIRGRSVNTHVMTMVYGVSQLLIYGVSTLSHWVQQPQRKHQLRIWDQGVIYLLIAGTYTPLVWCYMQAATRGFVLTVVWCAAWLGTYLKVVSKRRVVDFSSRSYLLLGWIPAVILIIFVPPEARGWIVAGGLAYTVGTYFLMRDGRYPYFHAIWHLLVVAGGFFHFLAVIQALQCGACSGP